MRRFQTHITPKATAPSFTPSKETEPKVDTSSTNITTPAKPTPKGAHSVSKLFQPQTPLNRAPPSRPVARRQEPEPQQAPEPKKAHEDPEPEPEQELKHDTEESHGGFDIQIPNEEYAGDSNMQVEEEQDAGVAYGEEWEVQTPQQQQPYDDFEGDFEDEERDEEDYEFPEENEADDPLKKEVEGTRTQGIMEKFAVKATERRIPGPVGTLMLTGKLNDLLQ
jgi:hypothetical protein